MSLSKAVTVPLKNCFSSGHSTLMRLPTRSSCSCDAAAAGVSFLTLFGRVFGGMGAVCLCKRARQASHSGDDRQLEHYKVNASQMTLACAKVSGF